jgi:hypothetical protein
MVSPQDATEVVPYLSSAATIYFIQKFLKEREVYQRFVGAFPGADKWGHWFIAAVMSMVAAAGIHVVWTCSLCSVWDPNKGGTALITIPSIGDMVHGLSDWWKVYILQQAMHEVSNPKGAQAIRSTVTAVVVPSLEGH